MQPNSYSIKWIIQKCVINNNLSRIFFLEFTVSQHHKPASSLVLHRVHSHFLCFSEGIKLPRHFQFNVRYWFVLQYWFCWALNVSRIVTVIIGGVERASVLWLYVCGCSENALQASFAFLAHAYTVNNTSLWAKLYKQIPTPTQLLQAFTASCIVARGIKRNNSICIKLPR